jgi:hypothetical protein
MKIGTMLGVVAAAAAVAAIAAVAPARAAAAPANDALVAPAVCAADCDSSRAQPIDRPIGGGGWPDPEPSDWLLMLTGFIGLGAMLRASRPAFER